MLGDNPKRPPIISDGSKLFVKNIFKTVQGEGPNVGTPSIFIRLGGCNLACNFCDTEFENYSEMTLEEILDIVHAMSLNQDNIRSIPLIVITGGEPFRQNINSLCRFLIKNFTVQIETNGTLFIEIPAEVEVICSPKISNNKYYSPHPQILPRINAFKYLVSTTISGYEKIPNLGHIEYNIPVFVQAMDQYDEQINLANEKLALELVIENGYKLSYQIHKKLNIE